MSAEIKPLLAKLVDGQTLTAQEAGDFFSACLRGEPTPAQVAAAVTALRIRGETVEEIAAFAGAMRLERKPDLAQRDYAFNVRPRWPLDPDAQAARGAGVKA